MPSSALKDAFIDSSKGASESWIREGRLDKPELLLPPLMAELQLVRDDDEELEGSFDVFAPSFSAGLKMSHSSFCFLELSIGIGLAWVCMRFSSDRMIIGSLPRPFSWLRRIIPVSNRWYILFSRHSANSLASSRATSERVRWRCVRGKGIGAELVESVGLGLSRLLLLEWKSVIVDLFISCEGRERWLLNNDYQLWVRCQQLVACGVSK